MTLNKEEILKTFKEQASNSVESVNNSGFKNVIDSSKGRYFSKDYQRGYEDCSKDLIEILRIILFEPWYLSKKNDT